MNKLNLIANDLVPVYTTDTGEKVVNARDLHEGLGSKQDFSNWIKNRIEKYELVDDEDFSIILSKSTGGRPTKEYILKLDTAKEIAMVENNDQGRKVRKYFIEVEKRATPEMKKLALQQARVDIQMKNAETRLEYAKLKKADMLLKIADRTKIPEYTELINSKAIEVITGTQLIPLPQAERQTYSATQIGKRLGISANKVGKLANEHDLKTEEYGKLFYDKSKYSNKQVETFRYYEEVIPVFDSILKGMSA